MDHVEISLYILLVEKGATLPHSLCISIFSLFLLFFEFYIGEEGKKSMMEHLERRGSILAALDIYWCLHMIVQHVLDMQALALNVQWENALIFSNCFENMNMSDRSVWVFERYVGCTNTLLLDFYFLQKECSNK
jgi:hypothetical protein